MTNTPDQDPTQDPATPTPDAPQAPVLPDSPAIPVPPPMPVAPPLPVAPPMPVPPPNPTSASQVASPDAPATPKTAEIENMQVGEFLYWLFEKKLSGNNGVDLKVLFDQINLLCTQKGFSDDFNNIADKKIGPPTALELNDLQAGYGMLTMLLDEADQTDAAGNKITLPTLGSDEEMIAELEAFNEEVAGTSTPPDPTIPGTPADPDTNTAGGTVPPSANATGGVDPAADPDSKGTVDPDPNATTPVLQPKTSKAPRRIVAVVLATAIGVLGGVGIRSYLQNRGKKPSPDKADTSQTATSNPADAPTAEHTAVPADIPSPPVVVTTQPTAQPSSAPTAEPTAQPSSAPTTEPAPQPTVAPELIPIDPVTGLPEKITIFCTVNTVPEKCRLADPSIITQLKGCKLTTLPYMPFKIECVDANGFPGPVWATVYDADDRDMYTGPSTGENVRFTLNKL